MMHHLTALNADGIACRQHVRKTEFQQLNYIHMETAVLFWKSMNGMNLIL